MLNKKLTNKELNELIGYGDYKTDSFHVLGQDSVDSKYLLKMVDIETYEEFIQQLGDYILNCLKNNEIPAFSAWCSGTCCRSLLMNLVIKCEKESGVSLVELIISNLGADLPKYESELKLHLRDIFTDEKVFLFKTAKLAKAIE